MIDKQKLIDKLIKKAIFHGIGKCGVVGYHIKKLKGKDKEIIKELKAKDFDHRI